MVHQILTVKYPFIIMTQGSVCMQAKIIFKHKKNIQLLNNWQLVLILNNSIKGNFFGAEKLGTTNQIAHTQTHTNTQSYSNVV
jgi:hypothetical protein